MAIQSLKKLKDKGIQVKHIIGDTDTTTGVKAKKVFQHKIVKSLDKNHVIKNPGNLLYALKKQHKCFSTPALYYIQKGVQYAIATNQTKEILKLNINAIVPHAFDDHHLCKDRTWCTTVHDPCTPHVYKSLPGGKPLQNVDLKKC